MEIMTKDAGATGQVIKPKRNIWIYSKGYKVMRLHEILENFPDGKMQRQI